jgi:hypothetical protein
MNLTSLLAVLKGLQLALQEEIERARTERQLLRTLDAQALLERAARRNHFNSRAAALERLLAVESARAAAAAGLPEKTRLADLAAAGGRDGIALKSLLAEVHALAAALGELDQLNHSLAERTLKVVRSYTAALVARPAAYDRMGRNLAAVGT